MLEIEGLAPRAEKFRSEIRADSDLVIDRLSRGVSDRFCDTLGF